MFPTIKNVNKTIGRKSGKQVISWSQNNAKAQLWGTSNLIAVGLNFDRSRNFGYGLLFLEEKMEVERKRTRSFLSQTSVLEKDFSRTKSLNVRPINFEGLF